MIRIDLRKIDLLFLIVLLLSLFSCKTMTNNSSVASDALNISSDSSGFVLLSDAVPDAILEIRYYSTYNFVGKRIAGYEDPIALITKEAQLSLKR